MLNNKSVLILDDDTTIQQILLHIIKTIHCSDAEITSNVDQAIFYLEKKKYDLIFLDLMLPEKNGKDLLNYLKDNDIWVPVIVYSSSSEKEKKDILTNYLMLQNLSISILNKPCAEIRIIEVISDVLERQHCSELKYKVMPELYKNFSLTKDELQITKDELNDMKKSLSVTIKDIITDDLPKLVAESIKKNQKAFFTFLFTALSTAIAYYSGLIHDFVKK